MLPPYCPQSMIPLSYNLSIPVLVIIMRVEYLERFHLFTILYQSHPFLVLGHGRYWISMSVERHS